MNLDKFNKILENEQKQVTKNLWGSEITFKPKLLEKKYGDGLQLIYIGLLNIRPLYWLIKIDSSCDIEDDEFQENILEEIIEDLEEEFVFYDDENEDKFDSYASYPYVYAEGGYHWGLIYNAKTNEEGILEE